MKRNVLFALFAFILLVKATAQSSGIYESYAILSLNGGANTYYDLQASTANPDFNGSNLGMFRAGTNQLVLNGGQNKTFKNGGCDITNGVLQYRIYPTAGAPGSLSPLNMSFLCEYPTAGCGSNSGDQVWEVANGNVNILTGLNPGSYTLEVYTSANYQGCGTGTHYSNNGGANYKASFTVYTDFITKWNLATTGSGATQLSFGVATSGTVSYTWQEVSPGSASGSGTFSGSNLTITGLPTGSIIKLNISPANFQRIIIDGGTDRKRLIDVEQWGSITWISMERAFYGCSNLNITAADVPNLTGVTNMQQMFMECSSLNGPSNIGNWNTSNVTNMNSVFALAFSFNQPLGNWNTSSVATMTQMFWLASSFNQQLNNWNTESVITMDYMFWSAGAFNQPLQNWNTSNVTGMRRMFSSAIAFNQNLGTWTLNANVNLTQMFDGSGMDCSHYSATLIGWNNNPLTPNNLSLGADGRQYSTVAEAARTNLTTIKGWTITGDAASGSNCDPTAFITTWKTDNAGLSSITSIFIPTTGTGYNYDVDWNNDGVYDQLGITGNVTHDFTTAGIYTIRIRGAFPRIFFNNDGDKAKLLNISQWGSIAWTSMENAFFGCVNLNITATDVPNLSGVTDMSLMFANCLSLNGPANIGTWNTSTVTNMSQLFSIATAFNQPLNGWNTSAVTNMNFLFNGASAFNQSLNSWNTGSVTTMARMFYQASAFNGAIDNWNTSSVTNMSFMFYGALLFNQPIGNWNTSNVTTMYNMFAYAYAFNQPIGTWNTSRVTDMSYMFAYAYAFNQPIGNWNTGSVQNMISMFLGANAFNQPIGNWNTGSVQNMISMFVLANAFNQPIGGWNTASVGNMASMFEQTNSFNQDISNWNISGVQSMYRMFWSATAFNQNLGKWTLNPNVDLGLMLDNSGMNCANYSATLIGWSKNPLTPSSRNLGASGRQYNYTGLAARNYLTGTKGWTIGDAGNGATSTLGATTGGAQVCQNTDVSLGRMYTDGCNSLLMITPNGASPVSGTINACVKIDNAVQFYNGEPYLQRHFDITPANNPTSSTARITLYALQSEFDAFNVANASYFPDLPTGPADAVGIAALRVTQYSGTGTAPGNYTGLTKLINPDDADIVWNGYHWEISFNVTGFSGFYIHAPRLDFALPVTLLSFSGYKDGSRNQLSWTTAFEINNRGFDVQRSTDGVNYTSIGFVNSLATGGNSNDKLSYRFTDNTPAGVKQYYRLRQEDFDGRNKLSNIVLINGAKPVTVAIDGLFPNPASSVLNVLVSAPERTRLTLLVTDMAGRTLSQKVVSADTGSNTIQLDINNLASGTYMVRVVCADGCQPVPAKFVKH